jgi:hypothetical protein
VANALELRRKGAVGFIVWLELFVTTEEADDDVLNRLHYLTSTAMAMVAADIV